ncbi:expressed unknown protein [Seminavis robusta]|uniref:P/Homo B domain-containing protein n=1 Tax=Seminavis robusta TaxID=568900 RepID=A0A9N8HPP7_9STRA|nr:expressed unknown protein [Seminavis robusta]|eukprot:Sro918_g220031.1  (436) ;mRNA; r:24386-25693
MFTKLSLIALGLLGSLSPTRAATPVTYTSDAANSNLRIPLDTSRTSGPTVSNIFVDATFEICDVDISVDITHTWTSDLEIDISLDVDGPDPTTDPVDMIRLQYDDCERTDDLVVVFDDSSTNSLDGASEDEPLCDDNGVDVRPEESLSTFNGHQSTGYWTLHINDDAGADIGTLNSWSVILTPCEPITDGAGTGDPHFKTWVGEWFDFHGECDLVFIDSPKFGHGTGLAIHIRTKARYQYSFIESAAVQIGDSVLEVGEYGNYMLDGVSNAELEKMDDKYPVTHKKVNSKQHIFTVELGEGKQIIIQSFKDLVSVKTVGASPEEYRGSQGLLGEFGTGKWMSRNGTVMADADAFGNEWQVLETEPKLFQTNRFPQHPVKCSMPGPEREGRRRLGESTISMEAAEKVCEHWGDLKDQCVYDVMAAEDLELAEAGAF